VAIFLEKKKSCCWGLSQKDLDTQTILGGIKKVNRLYPGSGGLERPLEVFNFPIDPKKWEKNLKQKVATHFEKCGQAPIWYDRAFTKRATDIAKKTSLNNIRAPKAMSHSTFKLRVPKKMASVSRLSNTCGKNKNVKPTMLLYNVAKLTNGHLRGYP
jgi:hypothetical protein